MAVSLPRAEDMEMLPAWLGLDDMPSTRPPPGLPSPSAWPDGTPTSWCSARAARPAGGAGGGSGGRRGRGPHRAGRRTAATAPGPSRWWTSRAVGGPAVRRSAGGRGRARREGRVDGPARRRGAAPAAFFDLLNGRKESVALDPPPADGVRVLQRLVRRADVVIEASRPRALAELGIHAAGSVRDGGPQVWVSITGHGRAGDAGQRVGFGDDAAAAGGLVVWAGPAPMFCADAVADPLSGLTAASACLESLAEGGRWLLDVSMAGVCAGLAGPTLPLPPGLVPAPRAREPERAAPALGADTAQVVRALEHERF